MAFKKAHRQTGVTLDLEGAEDDDIGNDLRQLWVGKEFDMPSARAKCIQEVKDDCESGRITSFSQRPEILGQYPAHAPHQRGTMMLARVLWR